MAGRFVNDESRHTARLHLNLAKTLSSVMDPDRGDEVSWCWMNVLMYIVRVQSVDMLKRSGCELKGASALLTIAFSK